jgi:hypothetical protein
VKAFPDTATDLAELEFQLKSLYVKREMLHRDIYSHPTYGPVLAEGGSLVVGGWKLEGRKVKPENATKWQQRKMPRCSTGHFIKLTIEADNGAVSKGSKKAS